MSIANRFTSVPAVPQGGFTDYQTVLIGAVKENVELLTGLVVKLTLQVKL